MLGDILLATLSAVGLPERIPIKSVHSAFWKLRATSKYGPLLGSLAFVMGPDVPVSEELETALFRLCSSGLCTVDNPDFRYLRIGRESRSAMREVLRAHLEESDLDRLETLEELSKEFERNVCSWMKDETARLSIRGL